VLNKPIPNIENNQMKTTGANMNATFWVPQCCRAKRPISMTQAINKSTPIRMTVRVCLDLGKLKGKKKNLKSSFLSIVWFEESQKEKK